MLIANPGNADAQVEATYLLPDGTVIVKPQTVAKNSRFNIWVDREDPRLVNTAVSTTIRSTNGVPVIVERALWWPGSYGQWYEAHNSPGATSTGTRWALAEGEVGGTRGVETYILLANTSSAPGKVKVTLLFEDGTSAMKEFDVAARSRFNVDARWEFPAASTSASAPSSSAWAPRRRRSLSSARCTGMRSGSTGRRARTRLRRSCSNGGGAAGRRRKAIRDASPHVNARTALTRNVRLLQPRRKRVRARCPV